MSDWIPTSERLPDESGLAVLIYVDTEVFQMWADEDNDNQRFYDSNYTGDMDIWNPVAVCHWAKQAAWLTHWMPLPEPPK